MTQKTTEEMLSLIDALADRVDEHVLNGIKFLLVSQDIDEIRHALQQNHPRFHDLVLLHNEIETLKLQLTIRFGVMVATGVGVLATLVKLL